LEKGIEKMCSPLDDNFCIDVESTSEVCPVGQKVGRRNLEERRIPVLSCEGGCIRGEIARLAANLIGEKEGFARGCHGELFTLPNSEISQWIKKSEKVILIDGCFLRCHERIMKNLLGENQLVNFDALSHYEKYTDLFDINEVPEEELKQVAQSVADWVLSSLERDMKVRT
jgi:uncharacterized metal-binding protein